MRRDDALRWSRLAELSVDRNETPVSSRIGRLTKFGELVRLHIEDMTAVGKPPRRSKAATLDMLQRELGAIKITALDRGALDRCAVDRVRTCQLGRRRRAGDARVDIGAIGLGLSQVAALNDLAISAESEGEALIAMVLIRRVTARFARRWTTSILPDQSAQLYNP